MTSSIPFEARTGGVPESLRGWSTSKGDAGEERSERQKAEGRRQEPARGLGDVVFEASLEPGGGSLGFHSRCLLAYGNDSEIFLNSPSIQCEMPVFLPLPTFWL